MSAGITVVALSEVKAVPSTVGEPGKDLSSSAAVDAAVALSDSKEVKEASSKYDGKLIDLNSVIKYLPEIIKTAEALKLTPEEKKIFVLVLVKKAIANSGNLSQANKDELTKLVDLFVPAMIDSLIAAEKGKFDMLKKKSCCW